MKLDEHGNLVGHHPSCAKQIDPICRCTCEREENYDENIKAAEAIEDVIERISNGTLEQFKAYKALSDRWAKVGIPQPQLGYPESWIVEVTGESGSTMWIGIEPDGSTNS